MYSLITKSEENWKGKKSGDMNKLNTFCLFETSDPYGFPEVCSNEFVPKELLPFHMSKGRRQQDSHKTLHFFLDDYKFEQVWTNPQKYTELLKFYEGIISPTFSVWNNQPLALNLFNMYRSRWITRYYQEQGIKVLVDVRWAEKDSYDYCFSGIEVNSPVIVNTVGTKMLENRRMFVEGFFSMLDKVQPSKLYVYGEYMPVEFEKYFDEVTYFKSFWAERRDKILVKR